MNIKSFLFDQLTPVALYGEIKKIFPYEISMLFESVVISEDGNFSFIAIGAKERLIFQNNQTIFIDQCGDKELVGDDPFKFLQEYYKKVDQKFYKELSNGIGLDFIDGFIGFIAYDMVKVFEPTLRKSMDGFGRNLFRGRPQDFGVLDSVPKN